MGRREKKTGKGRLDKYYKLAKEQGYRARSAFKLIQLNKRYQFLESARCCVDLCAAPGGWLQVAAKWMPPNSLILGVDLVPIKPIPKVLTATEDIRTDSCRRWLKNELKDWKADLVLHDGAPNVGTAWVQDAYSQAELVLHSLKLATEMLAKNGCFITKIFRSKDYNSLLYIFNKLFNKVEATKPPSSRNVSAEIFVVCQGYLSPKKIDPRLLDPAHVFKDLDPTQSASNDQAEAGTSKLTPNALSVFKPEKKRRMREGYDEGDYTLHKSASAHEFINAVDPIKILGVVNTINFTSAQEDQSLLKLRATNSEIKTNLQDLKVLGKGEFKKILKWRNTVRELLGLDQKQSQDALEEEPAEAVPLDENTLLEQELARLQHEETLKTKRDRRRLNERRTREVQRMQLQMTAPMDIGLELADAEVFGLQNMESHELNSDAQDEDFDVQSQENSESEEGSSDRDTDQGDLSEEEVKLQTLEKSLSGAYNEYQENQLKKNAKQKAREEARRRKHVEEGPLEWRGCDDAFENDEASVVAGSGDDLEVIRQKRTTFEGRRDDDGSNSDSEGEDVTRQADRIMAARNHQANLDGGARKAKQNLLVDFKEKRGTSDQAKRRATDMWFDQPVFRSLPGIQDLEGVEEEASSKGGSDHEAGERFVRFENDDSLMHSASEENLDEMEQRGKSAPDIWEEEGSDQDEKNASLIKERGFLTPQALQLAIDLVNRKKTKDQLIDSGFRRDAFFDEKDELPAWFLDDEMRHYREHVPVTKETVQILRDKMRALNARPIKKIAEAKGRKKLRTLRRIEKMRNKANTVNETNDISEKEKSMEIQKLMKQVRGNPKSKKSTVKVIVAKGVNKGQKGRPRGVKGRYKMVDPRGRKELRAKKRQLRNAPKKRK